MTGKEILALQMVWPDTGCRESIGNSIRDLIDESLCEEVFDKIWRRRKLTEADMETYNFYNDPIWKKAWNKKIKEIHKELKIFFREE